MAVPSTLVLLSALVSLFFLLSPSTANEGNLIVTGDVLHTDSQLSVPGANLVIQNDGNLVLYNKGSGFQSGTSGFGPNCTATISEHGQLQVRNNLGNIIWSSDSFGPIGEYAAILQPDGHVGIYGPALWRTRPFHYFRNKNDSRQYNGEHNDEEEKFVDQPNVPNMLFSSEVLNENSTLVSRDYTLGVKEGCFLEFAKASGVTWSSSRTSYGSRHCFARLNFCGQLAVIDDSNRIVWKSTDLAFTDGVYVLVVKISGEAVIYGKRIWLI